MKATLPLFCSIALISLSSRADTPALWTFEASVPPTTVGYSNLVVSPDIGAGSLSGHHANVATTFGTATGNGSSNCLSANYWASGDYWLIQVSTLGYKDLHLSFDQGANPTGPTNFTLAYSTDGSSFTTFFSYRVLSMNFNGNWDPLT